VLVVNDHAVVRQGLRTFLELRIIRGQEERALLLAIREEFRDH